jgi:hypothetical protein
METTPWKPVEAGRNIRANGTRHDGFTARPYSGHHLGRKLRSGVPARANATPRQGFLKQATILRVCFILRQSRNLDQPPKCQ